ncbi:adenosine deaminase [Eurytemora carolleeae]|uniref:adenosine deaminase n=1 Tax=Eurytemora carolleeae TaxID=1294199 RepID=UPI000C790127|nr:adenosine deaminase [Eurytemora carolleeae]|eukprot:XP_023335547.1 adenosine deaminase-like [Eurytemora affinis]
MPTKFHGPKRTKNVAPLSRAELHIHFDGAVRLSTIWELCKQKGLPLPGRGTIEDLRWAVQMSEPSDLAGFLSGFRHTAPALTGDIVAMERVAWEFCEDIASNGILYVEARFCPHLLVNPAKEGEPTADDILEATLRGFSRGEAEFGICIRTILCCIRGLPAADADILRQCNKYRDQGVVGLDIAGDEAGCNNAALQEMFDENVINIYDEARRLNIKRTVHAGEVGPAKCVDQALNLLHAMRIGHGYRVLEDQTLYQKCLKDRVHFETCPTSSILTGAQPTDIFYHATVRFAEDGANFSINSDDPMVTGTWLEQEYELVRSWGLNETHIVRGNVNAVKSSFLPADEKKVILKKLYNVYHLDMD